MSQKVISDHIECRNGFIELSRSDGQAPPVAPAGRVRLYGDPARGLQMSVDGAPWSSSAANEEQRIRFFDDFTGNAYVHEVEFPLFSSSDGTNVVTTGNTHVISGIYRASRAGVLASAAVVGATTLAVSDTNYVTFAATNKLGNGAGAIALLAGGDAATTKQTGGSAWTAYASRNLALSATALDLVFCTGDVIEFTVTVTGTLANAVARPMVRFLINEVRPEITGGQIRTTSIKGPSVAPVLDAPGGLVDIQLNDGSGNNQGHLFWNNLLGVDPTKHPIFRTRLKVSGVSANQHMVWGLGSTSNEPDTMTYNAWFRLEGASLALLAETDDNVTNRDDQATGITLVADTWYVFEVDLTDLAAVTFTAWDDNGGAAQGTRLSTPVSLSAAAMPAGANLQPWICARKTTGTQTDKIRVDWWSVEWDR